jgi:hypothetical protein
MKKQLFISIVIFLITLSVNAEPTQSFESLDSRITDLELNQLKNKINFSADTKVLNSFLSSKGDPTTAAPRKNNDYVSAGIFRLNMNSEIDPALKVYAGIFAYSLSNDSLLTTKNYTETREYQAKGEGLRLIKAYFDYGLIQDKVILSLGRLPTMYGPPEHLRNGTERTGTYPTMAYSVPIDGSSLTLNWHEILNTKNDIKFITRSVFAPGVKMNSNSSWRGTYLGKTTDPYQRVNSSKNFVQMVEFEHNPSNKNLYKKLLSIFQYGTYQFASFSSFAQVGLTPGDNTTYKIWVDQDKLFTAQVYSLYTEMEDLFGSQFDGYFTISRSNSRSEAKVNATVLNYPGSTAAEGTTTVLGDYLHPGKVSATRFMVGTRYEFKKSLYLGGEYVKSSTRSLPNSRFADTLVNFDALNGEGQQVYIVKNLYNSKFMIQGGYGRFKMNQDITNGFYYVNSSEKLENYFLNLGVKF